MKNIVILISGRGSNMEAIVRTRPEGARIAAVIANRPDAAGLVFAHEQGIPVAVVDHRQHASRDAFDAALMAEIDRHAPDLVVLAGFMRILGADFTRHYANRMINIHPSLLPAFTGLDTHARAIAAGCRLAGCTVHFVTAELDHGPIIAQAAVPVLDDDTPDTLARRILAEEHRLLPEVVRHFCQDRLQIDGLRVRLKADGHA